MNRTRTTVRTDELRPAERLPRRPHLPPRGTGPCAADPAGPFGEEAPERFAPAHADLSLDLVALLTPAVGGKLRRGAA